MKRKSDDKIKARSTVKAAVKAVATRNNLNTPRSLKEARESADDDLDSVSAKAYQLHQTLQKPARSKGSRRG